VTLRTVTVEAGAGSTGWGPSRDCWRLGPLSCTYWRRLRCRFGAPSCGSDQIHRSRTRGTSWVPLAILLIRPYRCEECD